MHYSKDLKLFAVGGRGGTVSLVNSDNFQQVDSYKKHDDKITDLTFVSYKGHMALATSSLDKGIKIYGIEDKGVIKNMKVTNKTTHASRVLVYAWDEKTIISAHNDGRVVLNNFTSDGNEGDHVNKFVFSNNDKITCVAYPGDGITIIAGTKAGNVDIFSVK